MSLSSRSCPFSHAPKFHATSGGGHQSPGMQHQRYATMTRAYSKEFQWQVPSMFQVGELTLYYLLWIRLRPCYHCHLRGWPAAPSVHNITCCIDILLQKHTLTYSVKSAGNTRCLQRELNVTPGLAWFDLVVPGLATSTVFHRKW